jgi:hypothetical protein
LWEGPINGWLVRISPSTGMYILSKLCMSLKVCTDTNEFWMKFYVTKVQKFVRKLFGRKIVL